MHHLEDLMGMPHQSFAEVPTALFARVRARNREAGIDAASVELLLAAARQDVEDAARDLIVAARRDRRRERRRGRKWRGEVVHE
ncbi:MAG TPA: hypothetical protein VFT38_11930 [Vicinamibacteria bacterium]|nr:hypothetical protein [Vicinamibacteria bacterium]